MLKRSSSSSSLRLWTRTQRGGAFFVSDKTEIVFFESSFFRGRERAKERKSASETTTTMDAPDYTREREMIRLNPTTTTTRKSLSPSFSLRVECLSQNTQDSTHYWAHARAQKKTDPLSRLFSRVVVSSGVTKSSTAARQKALPKTRFERLHRTNPLLLLRLLLSGEKKKKLKNTFINPKQKKYKTLNTAPSLSKPLSFFLFLSSFVCFWEREET